MSERNNDDYELDELLTRMPKFTDDRPKEEVYNSVKMNIDSRHTSEKRKLFGSPLSKWTPYFVSIASILLLTFLVTSFLNEDETAMENDRNNAGSVNEESNSMKMVEEESSEAQESTNSNNMSEATSVAEPSIELLPLNKITSVYERNIDGGAVFHFSFLENALSVPVTIIIPIAQLEADFPNGTPNSLEMYEKYATRIDEEGLGFTEYHPYKGYFTADEETLTHYLPMGHGYDTASGTSAPYFGSINEIFIDFDSLTIVNEDGSAIDWDQVGPLNNQIVLDKNQGQFNYYNYLAFNGETYLTPNFREKYNSLSEALVAMKKVENDIYTSVIPEEVTYTYKIEEGINVVEFDEPLDLESLDPFEATRLIEAFSLTAANFGAEIKLQNIVQSEWDIFDFAKVLPVPLGPNGFIMTINE